MARTADQLERVLLELMSAWSGCIVAYSGGVDSAVVAKAAVLALGDNCLAVTASSASLAEEERKAAVKLAGEIGIQHQLISTMEFSNPAYLQNDANRCFHCKSELYSQMKPIQQQLPEWIVVNGANADDTQDYRPGMVAAKQNNVVSPLADCGMTKIEVRQLARHWQISAWDKPAAPCLSSRIAYGQAVTPERLRMIEAAEKFLREHGFRIVRVRYHEGDLARIEVPIVDLVRLLERDFLGTVEATLRDLGFRFITVDLGGFRSGSLNTLVPLEVLQASVTSED